MINDVLWLSFIQPFYYHHGWVGRIPLINPHNGKESRGVRALDTLTKHDRRAVSEWICVQ